MGMILKSQSIEIQNPSKSPVPKVDLVWTIDKCHGGQNKVSIEFAYILHAHAIIS
jgi:hypothetical protein